MPQHDCCLNNARTKLVRGDYVAVCIYQFPLFISDKNKHEVSDQTYNCPHNSYEPGISFIALNTFVKSRLPHRFVGVAARTVEAAGAGHL
jgi:hypothetical protein